MANVRITDLTSAAPLADTDSVVVDRAAGTGRASIAEVRAVLEAGGTLADLPTETRAAGFDDLTTADAWHFDIAGDAAAQIGPGAAAASFPSSGVLALEGGTSGGSGALQAWRVRTGLVLDATTPIVIEYRIRPIAAGVYDDTEAEWKVGIADADGLAGEAVILGALWDDGTSTRTYVLAVVNGGVPTTTPIVLPALGVGQSAYRIRLTITPTGATVEATIDEGAWSTLAALAHAPTATTYHPHIAIAPEGGAGNRVLLVDYARWTAARLATGAGATLPDFGDATPSAGVTDHGALTGLTDDDHTQYARTDGSRAVTGAQSFNAGINVTGTAAVTGNVTATGDVNATGDVYGDTVVATGGMFTNGGTGTVLDHTTGAPIAHVGAGGAAHAEATRLAAGFMPAIEADAAFAMRDSYRHYCDFENGITGTVWVSSVSGAGAAVGTTGTTYPNHVGVTQLSTGTTTTGRASIALRIGALLQLGAGLTKFDVVVQVPALSDGTETFDFFVGLADILTGEPTDGVYFASDHDGLGAHWYACCAEDGVRTRTSTGVTVAAGTWVRLGAVINAAGTSVDFYVDSNLVATTTADIPVTSDDLGFMATQIKSAGTTARTSLLDLVAIEQRFSTPR